MGASETEIPLHDLIGYRNIDFTLASASAAMNQCVFDGLRINRWSFYMGRSGRGV